MKGVVVNQYCDFDKAEVGLIKDPKAGSGEVVVALETAEVNFPDKLYIEGQYQKQLDFPFSPGLAGTGTVCAVGAGVDESMLGQRVLALPEYGTYAEKVSLPAEHCFVVPDGIDSVQSSALGLAYQTAYFALSARGNIRPGDNVLVLGATGGVGMAAVQLAKAMGAGKVLAGTRGGINKLGEYWLGADEIIDTAPDDLRSLASSVKAATEGQGVDIVIDTVGGALGEAALRAMAWNGRFVVVGFASGAIPKFAGNYLLVKNISVSGLQWTDYLARHLEIVHQAQDKLFEWCRTGLLAPRIHNTYPLEDYATALNAVCSGAAQGRIVLTISRT